MACWTLSLLGWPPFVIFLPLKPPAALGVQRFLRIRSNIPSEHSSRPSLSTLMCSHALVVVNPLERGWCPHAHVVSLIYPTRTPTSSVRFLNFVILMERSPLKRFCFRGASYGNLILSSYQSCVVFDMFTGVCVSSPQMSVFSDTQLLYGALTAPPASPNSHLIVDTGSQNLFWRVGNHSWVGCTPHDGPIKQIVVFKHKVFGMDSHGTIFKVHLTPRVRIQKLPVMESSMIEHLSNPRLVACGDMLLLIGLLGGSCIVTTGESLEVFRLDLSAEPALWLKVEKLENWAIFISTDNRSQALSCMNPEMWGGRSNCIYCYNHESKHWIALELGKPLQGDGSKFNPDDFIFMGSGNKLQTMWIFPSMLSLHR